MKRMRTEHPDGRQNLAILAAAVAGCVLCLWIASQPFHIALRVLSAVAFAFIGNTIFALLHEAVHGNFHSRRWINETVGILAAAFFPTSFTLQRAFHLAHHGNNRSELERFDYYDEGQHRVLKVAQWYSILTGLYWLAPPTFAFTYALTAELVPWQRLSSKSSSFGNQTSSRAFIESVKNIRLARVRFEVLTTIGVQATIILIADISLAGWCLCYGLFAINWSSLQYADHAFSCLDREEGAWNLKVHPVVRSLFLNYHYHLAHHRDPSVPWHRLPQERRSGDPELSFQQVLLCMWAGPRPLPGVKVREFETARPMSFDLLVNVSLGLIFGALFWILYGSAAVISSNGAMAFDLSFPGEPHLPFYPWFSAVYLSALVLFCLSPFLLSTPEKFLPLIVTAAFQVLTCWWIFVCLPFPTPPVPLPKDDIGGLAFVLADTINLEGNNLPSLHVALTFTVASAMGRELGRLAHWLLLGWAIAVAISTLLTQQHIILDVVAGGALAWASLKWVYPRVERELREGCEQLGLDRQEVT